MKILKNTFLLILFFSILSFSSCEKVSEFPNPISNLSKADKNISSEFLKEKIYNGHIDLSGLGLTEIPNFPKYLTGTTADSITSISLAANKISNIDGENLEKLPNLKELNLSFNQIENTKGIEKISSKILSELRLTKSGVKKIDGISELTSLNSLFLSFNNIENVEGLENLKNLSYLELAHNKLKNIDNLSTLNNLLTLKIEFNQIKNVDKILNNEKSKLEMFTMKFNQIDEKIVEAVEANNQKVYALRHPENSDEMKKMEIKK